MTKLATTSEGHNRGAFAPVDWGLLLFPSLVFGSSFVLMSIGLEALEPGVISFGRIAFGFLALSAIPAAYGRIDREDRNRIVLLAAVWMAAPLTLFPLAQQHVSSALAGMINGGTPLMVALVATLMLRRLPGQKQLIGVAVGLAGMILIAAPALGEGRSSALGVLLLTGAIACYGVAFNLAVPFQQKYGSLPVIRLALGVAALMTMPRMLSGLGNSEFEAVPVLAVVVLGAVGTGLAYAATASLAGRVGSTRSSVITYLATPVAIALGVGIRGDSVLPIQVAGAALALLGAYLATRADT